MNDELSFEAAELFRSARAGLTPGAADLARGKRRLAAALAGGGIAAGGAGVAKAGGLSSTAVVATLIAGTLSIAGGVWWRGRLVAPTVPEVAPHVLEVGASAEVVPEVAPSAVAEVAPPVMAPARAMPAPVRTVPEVVRTPAIYTPPADDLARELELVRTADAALRAGDPTRALAIARADNVNQLAAELAAIEIDALCALGRHDEARARVDAFRQRFPGSALADRVKRSCEGGTR